MKRQTHVRPYVRSRHGTSDHGGRVSEHDRGFEPSLGLRKAAKESQSISLEELVKALYGPKRKYYSKKDFDKLVQAFRDRYNGGVVQVERLGNSFVVMDWQRFLNSTGYDFGKPELVLLTPDEYWKIIHDTDPSWRADERVSEIHLEEIIAGLKQRSVYDWSGGGDAIWLGVKYVNGKPVWADMDQEGAHRVEAARRLGQQKVPVILYDKAFKGMHRGGADGWEAQEILRGRYQPGLEYD